VSKSAERRVIADDSLLHVVSIVDQCPKRAKLCCTQEHTLNEKNGKYVADWREKNGRRRRKTFTSKHAALRFEAEQKELAHPKQQARGNRSPSSYARPLKTGQLVTVTRGASSHCTSRKSPSPKPQAVTRPRSVRVVEPASVGIIDAIRLPFISS